MFNKKTIKIYEMFMRDGLQSIPKIYSLDDKKFFLDCLYNSNIKNIEFGSTTNEKILPQMKDSFELWKYIQSKNLETYIFTMLITNKKLLNKSINDKIKSFGLLSSISDSFSISNLKMNANESFENMINQFDIIYNMNKEYHTRLYLSCVFGGIDEEFNELYLDKIRKYLIEIYDKIQFYNLDYDKVDIVLCDTICILDIYILNQFKKI